MLFRFDYILPQNRHFVSPKFCSFLKISLKGRHLRLPCME